METFTRTNFNINNTQYYLLWLQIVDSLSELEALMERMKRLQEEREDEEASQEEMTTRFEKEKKESLFVVSGDTFHSFPHSGAFSISLSLPFLFAFDFPGSSDDKESACNAEDPGSIPGSGRSLLFLEPRLTASDHLQYFPCG